MNLFAKFQARREQKRLEKAYYNSQPLNKLVNSVTGHPIVILFALCAWLGAFAVISGICYGLVKLVQLLAA